MGQGPARAAQSAARMCPPVPPGLRPAPRGLSFVPPAVSFVPPAVSFVPPAVSPVPPAVSAVPPGAPRLGSHPAGSATSPCRAGPALTRKRCGSGSGVSGGRMAADTQVRRVAAGVRAVDGDPVWTVVVGSEPVLTGQPRGCGGRESDPAPLTEPCLNARAQARLGRSGADRWTARPSPGSRVPCRSSVLPPSPRGASPGPAPDLASTLSVPAPVAAEGRLDLRAAFRL